MGKAPGRPTAQDSQEDSPERWGATATDAVHTTRALVSRTLR